MKYFAWFLLIFTCLLVIGTTCNWFSDGAKVVNEQFNLSALLKKGETYKTSEVQDEYGTYGSSSPYFYWFDAQNNYHQYYPSGDTFVHISDRPLKIKKSNLSVEIL